MKENHFFVFFHLSTFQVPGYLVFGTGQPTKEGFQASLIIFFGNNSLLPLWYVRKCHEGQLNSSFVENHMIMAFCIFLVNFFYTIQSCMITTQDNNKLLLFQATLSHIFSEEVGAKKCLWTNMRQVWTKLITK